MKEDNKKKKDLSDPTGSYRDEDSWKGEDDWDVSSAKHIYKDLFINGSFQAIRNQLVGLCHGKNRFGDPSHFISPQPKRNVSNLGPERASTPPGVAPSFMDDNTALLKDFVVHLAEVEKQLVNKHYNSDKPACLLDRNEHMHITAEMIKYCIDPHQERHVVLRSVLSPDGRTVWLMKPVLHFWLGALDLSLQGGLGLTDLHNCAIMANGSLEQFENYKHGDDGASLGVTAFASSEVTHGSNLREAGTEVHLIKGDKSSKRMHLVVKTPSTSHVKMWPGNLFSARSVVILARLFVEEEDEGIHWFRLDLFQGGPDSQTRVPGYSIRDIGTKGGYKGVENGFIHFHSMCVPVDSLLCGWAQIKDDGSYVSDVPKEKRFSQCLKNFYFERFAIASGALGSALCGLMIALKYSKIRRQFGPPGKENTLLTYGLHKNRLLKHLSTVLMIRNFVTLSSYMHTHYRFDPQTPLEETRMKYAYVLSNLCKVMATKASHEALIEARELCGGHGYLLSNLIVGMQNDVDPYKTFGGDNNLMMLESAKHLVRGVSGWSLMAKLNGPAKPFFRPLGKKSLSSITAQNNLQILFSSLNDLRKLFEYRQNHLQWKLARTLKAKGKANVEDFVVNGPGGQKFIDLAFSAAENMVCFCFYGRFCNPNVTKLLGEENRKKLRTNCHVAIYYSLCRIRSDPFFLLHGLVSSSFHTSIDTTLAELALALLRRPAGDESLTPLEKMIDFPDELLARSPLTHVDYVERMLAHSQSLPSYVTPAEEPLT
jgi:alkylation response protein AidB-like acyl-CoA dehydrogenase